MFNIAKTSSKKSLHQAGMIACVWKAICPFVFFILLLPVSESAIFTQEPPQSVTVRLGHSVWLHWKYVLEHREILLQNDIYFKNSTLNSFVIIASDRKLKPAIGFSKVKTYPGKNLSMAIIDADYSYTGIYYFEVTVDQPIRKLMSRNVSLIVQGNPKFCVGSPKDVVKINENENALFNIIFCASPQPYFSYKWNDGITKDVLPLTIRGSHMLYAVDISLSSLRRNQCGRYVIYYAKNDYGKSIIRQIKVIVLFKPEKPEGVKAHYINSNRAVKVIWNKQESGSCDIVYKVEYLNSTKQIVVTKSGKNVNTVIFNTPWPNIDAAVKVTASTSEGSSSVTAQVTSTAPTPTGSGSNKIFCSFWIFAGCSLVGIILNG